MEETRGCPREKEEKGPKVLLHEAVPHGPGLRGREDSNMARRAKAREGSKASSRHAAN